MVIICVIIVNNRIVLSREGLEKRAASWAVSVEPRRTRGERVWSETERSG